MMGLLFIFPNLFHIYLKMLHSTQGEYAFFLFRIISPCLNIIYCFGSLHSPSLPELGAKRFQSGMFHDHMLPVEVRNDSCETDGITQVSNVYEKHKGNHLRQVQTLFLFMDLCYQFNTKSLNLLKFSKIILFYITIHSISELDMYFLVLIT